MGNLITYSRPNTSIYDIHPNLKTLTNWLREDIVKLYKNYIFYISKNFYISRSELRRISRHTSLEGIEEVIFTYFLKPQFKRINIMELLAGIITYAFLDWEKKIALGIQIFDFDGSKNLTEDEFFIMAKCFTYGISIMTLGNSADNEVIKFLSQSVFADRSEMTINELIMWIRHNKILYDIFQYNSPSIIKCEKIKNTRFCNLERKTVDLKKPTSYHRRIKSSFESKREENFSVIIDSKIVTKNDMILIKRRFDEISDNGYVVVENMFKILKTAGYKFEDGLNQGSNKKISFYDFLMMLFKNATRNQISRLLKFVGMGEVRRASMDDEIMEKKKKIVDPKLVSTYKMMFEKYDANKDGRVNLKELKNALKNTFTEKAIENLFEKFNKEKSEGLDLKEFVKMYAPENLEFP
ncbi:hypothetical protein SteCoe_17122 [Stentor coeruleus]|uniref:EF-hand domain-containing protein n=1 Tax=Stentor coeruleus TaxID=5963 RepID=A0A1R2BZK5_9CILI|nr:hypothetical protein SteCoe_17122 [Stentor coeruleus]